jgi:hypothetical protein
VGQIVNLRVDCQSAWLVAGLPVAEHEKPRKRYPARAGFDFFEPPKWFAAEVAGSA